MNEMRIRSEIRRKIERLLARIRSQTKGAILNVHSRRKSGRSDAASGWAESLHKPHSKA